MKMENQRRKRKRRPRNGKLKCIQSTSTVIRPSANCKRNNSIPSLMTTKATIRRSATSHDPTSLKIQPIISKRIRREQKLASSLLRKKQSSLEYSQAKKKLRVTELQRASTKILRISETSRRPRRWSNRQRKNPKKAPHMRIQKLNLRDFQNKRKYLQGKSIFTGPRKNNLRSTKKYLMIIIMLKSKSRSTNK